MTGVAAVPPPVDRGRARADWGRARVGDVFFVQQGKALSAAARSAGERFPFLRTTNVLWGRVDVGVVDSMGMSPAERARLRLEAGDLLVCEGGEIGRAAMWRGEVPECYYQNHIHRLRPRSDADCEFYQYWLRYAFTMTDLYSGVGTKTTIANLSRGGLEGLAIPVPPLHDQHRIARSLATIAEAEGKAFEELARARVVREALLRELFAVEGADWPTVPLAEVASILSGGTPPKADAAAWTGEVPWVSPKDMRAEFLRDSEDHITAQAAGRYSTMVPPGSCLVAVRGMALAHGIPVSLAEVPVAFNQDLKGVVPGPAVNGRYLFYALVASRASLGNQIGTSAHGTKRLGTDAVHGWVIPVPSIREQERVCRALDTVAGYAAAVERFAFRLSVVFSSGLQQLMTSGL